MKNTLIVSFDLIRPGEVQKSLAIASILVYHQHYSAAEQNVDHLSVNMLDYRNVGNVAGDFDTWLTGYDLNRYDYIAISAYVWNEYLINPFIRHLRSRGYRQKIVLGGYQVAYTERSVLSVKYPDCQVFIIGYAEAAFSRLHTITDTQLPVFLETALDFSALPSPYLNHAIEVPVNAKMVRFETKRGCPYRCSFCAHRDLVKNSVYKHALEKVFAEISLFDEMKVRRANVLDPVFNVGKDYLDVMREIIRINTKTCYTLQSRFENIKGDDGTAFLDLCSEGLFHLEFGLQTAIYQESINIDRANNMKLIDQAFTALKERNVSYEVSLIYGLPGQTLDSFKASLDYVHQKGCTSVKAYPLMLLNGTKLYTQKEYWNMKEETTGEFNIPVVTSSSSFTKDDWYKMREIADSLIASDRF